jgi:hypothetical protein
MSMKKGSSAMCFSMKMKTLNLGEHMSMKKKL